jgi:c-di-GMP-binding flagellar brake protein YcgR
MAATKDIRSPFSGSGAKPALSERPIRATVTSQVRIAPGVGEFKERRRRRRIALEPMYTFASVRVLTRQEGPLEGHIVNLSETGAVIEVDEKIGTGQPVTVQFSVAGLGQLRNNEWPTYSAAAEVVRIDDLEDFPQGPYRIAMKFVRIPTMAQAQIARYIVTRPDKVSV